ncbi:prophage Lp1 protein 65 [Listeria grayi FSL F6-1183]|uniref:Prophage Lp1 protein 65 n=1 Tax=Listeria grayi FSL F6-1183 TaxID=1265827 RepID=A0A829R668_LISGR|nr:prophage Lp1 protein 65 [Listeria grayi FSL F6-1183]
MRQRLSQQKKEKEARKQVQAAEKEKQEQATKEKAAEKSVASSSQKSTSSPKTTTATPEKHGAIKGSVNKIYHVPGSTYYDRTTNVVQWFNTVEEAEAAGYRAPKR